MQRTWRMAYPLAVATLVGSFAWAQAAPPGDAKQRLIGQKIKLLDTLLTSPAAIKASTGGEPEAAQLIVKGRSAVDSARRALSENRIEDASRAVDEGMKTVAKATRRLQSESSLSDSAQRKTYDDLSEQLAGYRGAAADLTREPQSAEAGRLLQNRLDALTTEANQLFTRNRLGDANRKLAEAYKLATEEIARLRQGQEVVMRLKFESVADEYAYERKRFNSNEIMVEMMINDGKAEGDRRRLVDVYHGEARRLKRDAESRAQSGQYADALGQMERANEQMKRALQSLGIAVF